MSELRLYTFINFYLSSIQQGIQSAHVVSEMLTKYPYENAVVWDEPRGKPFHDWAKNHKTIVVLNGGAHLDIDEKYSLLYDLAPYLDFPMPFDKFHEDVHSLAGMITACGCVLPEEIYDAVDYRKASTLVDDTNISKYFNENRFYYVKDNSIVKQYVPDTPEHKLITMLKSCPLAR